MIELELVKNLACAAVTPVSRHLMKITQRDTQAQAVMVACGRGVGMEKNNETGEGYLRHCFTVSLMI